MGLSEMMRIRGGAIADDFSQDFCIARFSMLERLQRQQGCAFAQRKAITMRIKWTAGGWRQSLKRIEPGEDQFAQSIVATGEYTLRVTAPQQFPRVADSIGARSAGISDDRNRASKTERVHDIQRLTLRLIMKNPGRLSASGFWS